MPTSGTEHFSRSVAFIRRECANAFKNEPVELEMKMMLKARQLARTTTDELTHQRLETPATELEKKLREIDEQGRLSWRLLSLLLPVAGSPYRRTMIFCLFRIVPHRLIILIVPHWLVT
jgi:hypothetical protein